MRRDLHSIRTQWNLQLSLVVVKPWKSILKAFSALPSIEKAGIYTAYPGWVWFNFMYVRVSALQRLPPPQIGPRHWYEAYVSGHVNSTVFAPFPEQTSYSYPCVPALFNCLSLCPKWSFRDHMPPAGDRPKWPLCYPGPGLRSFAVPPSFEGPEWEDRELNEMLQWVARCRNERLRVCGNEHVSCPQLDQLADGVCAKDERSLANNVHITDFSS